MRASSRATNKTRALTAMPFRVPSRIALATIATLKGNGLITCFGCSAAVQAAWRNLASVNGRRALPSLEAAVGHQDTEHLHPGGALSKDSAPFRLGNGRFEVAKCLAPRLGRLWM